MKAHLLALLLLPALPALAQTTPTGTEAAQPFKGANVLLLTTADSASAAYDKLGRLLLAEGYTLDKADRNLGFVSTGFRAVAKGRGQVSLRFSVMPGKGGATIQARGAMYMPVLQRTALSGDIPVEYRGMKGSPIMAAWDELTRIASSYSAPHVSYQRQP